MPATKFIAASVLGLSLLACNREPASVLGPVPSDVMAAPSELVLGEATLSLSAFPWRDFQPSVDSRDTRLRAAARVTVSNGEIPSGLTVERMWVIFGDEAWISVPEQRPLVDPRLLEAISRGGPEWPIDALVTTVVQVRDGKNVVRLLRAAPQKIEKTI